METLTHWIAQITKLSPWVQTNLFTSIIIILILWLLQTLVMSIVVRRVEDVRLRYRWRKTSKSVAAALGVVLVGRVWFEGIQSLATFLGLFAARLTIVLKDVVTAIAGWFFIIWRRPFNVGDRIQIGQHAGDVIDVRIFKFTLMEIGNWVDADQSTGRVLHIPNGLVLSEIVSNYSRGFQYIWNELPVLVTFESNWKKAKTILQEIVTKHAQHSSEVAQKHIQEASRRFMTFYSVLTPTVYTRLAWRKVEFCSQSAICVNRVPGVVRRRRFGRMSCTNLPPTKISTLPIRRDVSMTIYEKVNSARDHRLLQQIPRVEIVESPRLRAFD